MEGERGKEVGGVRNGIERGIEVESGEREEW
jgi:hypothetical protein